METVIQVKVSVEMYAWQEVPTVPWRLDKMSLPDSRLYI